MAGRKVVFSMLWKVDGKKAVVMATTVVEGKVITSSEGPRVVVSCLTIGVVLCAVEVSSSGLPVVPGFSDLLSSPTLGRKELLLETLVAEVAVISLIEVSSTALSVVTLSLSSLVEASLPLTARGNRVVAITTGSSTPPLLGARVALWLL